MLQRAGSNGREISREDFYNIMTKKTFWFVGWFLVWFYLRIQWNFCLIFIKKYVFYCMYGIYYIWFGCKFQ